MLKIRSLSVLVGAALVCSTGFFLRSTRAAERDSHPAPYAPRIAPASEEGQLAIKRFRLPKGFKAELFAAEPLLANPVSFCIDEQGRFYVVETFRLHAGVTDIRGHMNWLDDDLASQSVEDRVAMMKKYEGDKISEYAKESDRVRLVVDSDGDGKADKSTVFSEGYNGIAEGIGAGVLARQGQVYFADIPNLWSLRDENGDGVAEVRKSLHYGFGVRVGFLGHDLHGLCFGPDGKLYFSIGDRGARVPLANGKVVDNPETGVIYRCNADGSDLEIFASGLRNPQELAFDNHGNLWTGDNNSDGGDPARWVYAVEGGDSGWRIGWQFINSPNPRGAWLSERMCYPQWDGQAAYILPPIANIANGPSGLSYYPGVGLPERYQEHFFLCDFRGSTDSGVHSFAVQPKGAGFEMTDRSEFVWNVLATDVDFGYDGCLYISDWVNGWEKPGKGRIYRVYDPQTVQDPRVAETRRLFSEGFAKRSLPELAGLLTHPDKRVRQEAQFALADHGEKAVPIFSRVARTGANQLARLHSIWGLGQVSARLKMATAKSEALRPLQKLLVDKDAEVRAQAAKVLGDARIPNAFAGLVKLLRDAQDRPRFFAAMALGKLGRKESVPPLLQLLRENNNHDRYLRHAGVMGLLGCADPAMFASLTNDASAGVRMAAVLALRRLARPEVAAFLQDGEPLVVAETARAIHDLPITEALPELAALASYPTRLASFSAGREGAPGPREPILRRVMNANFRLGTSGNALALAALGASENLPESARAQALTLLGDWEKPSGRDDITGLWRPLPPRDRGAAVAALQSPLPDLLKRSPERVRLSALLVAGRFEIKAGSAGANELLSDTNRSPEVRLAALKLLARLKDDHLPEAVKLALADRQESLRKEATQIQTQLKPADAVSEWRDRLENGSTGEKQAALAALGAVQGSGADAVFSEWMDKLLAKQVRPELQLDLLEAAGRRTASAVKAKLQRYEASRPAADPLAAYRECLMGGNSAEGKKIFLERPEASCVRCHKASGEGGEVGPELTGIGTRKDREYLLQSIIMPNAQIAPGFETVIVTLKNGTSYAGLVKSQDADSLELNSPEDGPLKLNQAEITSRAQGLSAMPEGMNQVLSRQDLRNLVEFLSSLK